MSIKPGDIFKTHCPVGLALPLKDPTRAPDLSETRTAVPIQAMTMLTVIDAHYVPYPEHPRVMLFLTPDAQIGWQWPVIVYMMTRVL